MVQVIFGLFGHKLSPKTFISKTEKTWPGLGKLRQTVRLIEEWKDCNNKVWLASLFDLRFFFSTALLFCICSILFLCPLQPAYFCVPIPALRGWNAQRREAGSSLHAMNAQSGIWCEGDPYGYVFLMSTILGSGMNGCSFPGASACDGAQQGNW